jgi:hypothetical protein
LRERNKKEGQQEATMNEQVTFKVGLKGGVSVYGLESRFPTTLYYGQWLKLLDAKDELLPFLEANKDKLKMKP